jgi:tetratricopeptide (TPR) repeat protein
MEALHARRRALGEEHWETQNSRYSLALSYRAQGRYAEAEPLFLQAAETLQRTIGADHPLTLRVKYNLAELYRRRKRFVEAESLFNQALEAHRRVFGDDNLYTAQVLGLLGETKLDQHAYGQAEPLLRKALRVRQAKDPDGWQRYFAESLLGTSLAGLGRYREAEPLVKSGYGGMLQRQASIPAEYRAAVDRARQWAEKVQ